MNTNKYIYTLVFIAVVLVLTACSTMPIRPQNPAPGDYAYVKEYISWLANKEMNKQEVTGLSLALVDDQQVVWAQGFGFADQENKVPAAPDTIYRAGSVSKLLTATAAMQLAEQGKLDIDKPLHTYIPAFTSKTRFTDTASVTPRSLMSHHSGLPSDLQKGMWTRSPEPIASLVAQVKEEYAAYPPNYVYAYSNLGMTLLGVSIEKVAGKGFREHMYEALLQPLNMKNSTFAPAVDRSALSAKPYRKGELSEEPSLRDIPAGGLNTTAVDLSRFMQMVFAEGKANGKQVIKPETLAEMLRSQNSAIPLDLNFSVGLAWHLSGLGNIDIKNAGPVAHHAGATINYHAMLIILPQYKLGVVVMANSAGSGRVVGRIAEEALKLALEAKSGIRQPDRKATDLTEAVLPDNAMQAYAGSYATLIGTVPVIKGQNI